MRWANKLTLAVVFAAAPWAAGSASAESLIEAVEAAIAYHPQVRRDQALAVAADHGVELAYSDFLPDLDASVSTGYEVTDSPTTRGAGRGIVDEIRTEGRVTLSQMIFDFFETSNRVSAARHDLRSSHATVQATAENIARLAVQNYIDVVQARELVALAERNVADHVAIVDLIRGRADAGRAAEVDLDQAISRLALVRSALIDVQGEDRLATSRYTETVGTPPGDLERPALPDFLEAEDLDAALATAMDRNPTAHATTANWDARRSEVDVARAAYYPRLDVEATAGAGENLDGTKGFRGDTSVLLRLTWNLFSGFGDLARTRSALFNANAASRIDAEARRAIREAVRVSFSALETSNQRLGPLREDVAASRQTFEAYRQQYDLGQRTLLDLLDARDEQFDSESELITGEMNVYRAAYELLFSTGMILDHMGIVIYEPELQYDERGEGINQAELGDPAAGEPDLAAGEGVEETAGILGEEAANLPGAGEFGFWLGGDVQRTKAALDEEESRSLLEQTSERDAEPTAGVRREIAEIEIRVVPEMASLPEAAVATLPAPAVADLDSVVVGGFQQDDEFGGLGAAEFLGQGGPSAADGRAAAATAPLQEGRRTARHAEQEAAADVEAMAYRALASLPLGEAAWLPDGGLGAQ